MIDDRAEQLHEPLQAARELVHQHGVLVDRSEILQHASTLVVRLSATLVARIVMDRQGPRTGTAWFAREIAVAQHLARCGAPVIPLHAQMPVGPHEHGGYAMNFWHYVHVVSAAVPPQVMGATLQQCHQALRSFSETLSPLAILDESLDLLDAPSLSSQLSTADRRLLRDCLKSGRAQLSGLTFQALHGDAHEGNLLPTTSGVLWTDWEDTFSGPVEWDLASLIWNEQVLQQNSAHVAAVLAGYRGAGGVIDESALPACLMARAAVMCAWYPLLYPQPSVERQWKLQRRLTWLREQKR